MSKTLVSKSEFSRIAHVSPAAIDKAIKHGRLKTVGEGRTAKIDISDDLSKSYLSAENDQRKPRKNGPQKKNIEADFDEETKQIELPIDVDSITFDDLKKYDKVTVDKWKILESVKTAKLEREKKRGLLIDRQIVKMFIGKIFTIEKNEFLVLGDRLAPKVAAVAGVNDPAIILKVNEIIEKESYKVLEHIQRITNDFLVKIEDDGPSISDISE